MSDRRVTCYICLGGTTRKREFQRVPVCGERISLPGQTVIVTSVEHTPSTPDGGREPLVELETETIHE